MAEIQEGENSNIELAASIISKMKPLTSTSWCIYKVPENLRTVKEEAYAPEIISIGPFHRGKPNLQAMEDHKNWYLENMLYRITKSSSSTEIKSILENLIKAVRELEIEAREYYSETIVGLNSNEFVEMMVRDGCFIIELLHKAVVEGGANTYKPILSLQRDLILLENQIPFVVLKTIFNMSRTGRGPEYGPSLIDQLIFFFEEMLPAPAYLEYLQRRSNIFGSQKPESPKHVLDLIRSLLLPSSSILWGQRYVSGPGFTHCVTEFCKAGLTFKRNDDADGILDIQFNSENGIIGIPPFFFKGSTDVLLRNLMAMEQCNGNLTHHVTSYVLLLGMLIKSEKDVRLLDRKSIVYNCLGDDEEMAVLINDLCKGVSINYFYYDRFCDTCNEYIKDKGGHKWSAMLKRDYFVIKWHEWKATLKRDYFNNPWAGISFIAAASLIVLTFLQTIYVIRFSYHTSSS